MLGNYQKYQGYRTYVDEGIDEEIKQFYNKGNTASVIGDKDFISWLRENKLPQLEEKEFVNQILPEKLSSYQIIQLVADYYKLDREVITAAVKGPKKGLLARKVAMYMCQQLGARI